uniref:Uncharacterized protein n=1 Tax=Oryza brachyantha TaxID=4533 RepID=J3ML26_ORYBR
NFDVPFHVLLIQNFMSSLSGKKCNAKLSDETNLIVDLIQTYRIKVMTNSFFHVIKHLLIYT